LYRTDAANSAPVEPTPAVLGTEGYFANPAGALDGATVDAAWLNALQGSLVAILDDQSIAHSKTDPTALRRAIESLVAQKVALVDTGRPGYESGLELTVQPTSTNFDIAPGACRDSANSTTSVASSGFSNQDASVAWNTGVGTLASTVTWVSGLYLRVFALGKVGDPEMNIGLDLVPNAAGLLADAAGDGFTTYRQIGWVVKHFGTNLLQFNQRPENREFFMLEESDLSNDRIANGSFGALIATKDLDCPIECLLITTVSFGNSDFVEELRWATFHESANPSAASATNHFAAYQPDLTSPNTRNCHVLLPTGTSGTGNRGEVHARVSAGDVFQFQTRGFIWSREIF
jgi:hypothetical protein